MRKSGSYFASSYLARHVAVLVLALGVGLSGYAFYAVRKLERADARVQFAKIAANQMVAVQANILKVATSTSYLGTAFEAAGDLDKPGFEHFAATVMSKNPIVDRLAWIQVVHAANHTIHYPILYVASSVGDVSSVGLDFASDPDASAALARATKSRAMVAVPNRAGFLDAGTGLPSFFVFAPVWTKAPTDENRPLRGFVMCEVRILSAVFYGAPQLGDLSPQVALFDLTAPPSEELLYPAQLEGSTPDVTAASDASHADFDIGAATWRIAALPATPLEVGITWENALVPFAGLAV